ncbi:MAG: methyltransferase domain-containing protein [Kofleriaceae bacterium]
MIKPAGIVRPPRRPPGWTAPGPPPLGARGRPELLPEADEDLCFLSGDWRIFQKVRGHRWSLDDLVTAWIACEAATRAELTRGEAPLRALDLGCGLGSVLLMVAWRFPDATVVGVEAQAERARLARRSIAYNGAQERCRVVDGDLRELLGPGDAGAPGALGPGALGPGADRDLGARAARFSLITGTPPYFPRGEGTESRTPGVAPCRFELRGGVEEYLAAGRARLAAGGLLVVCAAALERARVAHAIAELGLRWREHWEIVPRAGKPSLVTVDVVTLPGGDVAPARRDRRLVVRDARGAWTPAFRATRAAMGLPPETPRGE